VGLTLERGVALGPGGIGNQRRYFANRRYFAETAPAWARMWADWPTLQPSPDQPPDFRALDEDIAAARADGRKVMLTAYRFTRWANGTDAVAPRDDRAFQLPDRLAPGAALDKRKELTFKIPADLSPQSAWGTWIASIVDRYVGKIDALEIFNEPNLQFWPQQGPSTSPNSPYGPGELTVHKPVAQMIVTAKTLLDQRRQAPLLVAPALSDRIGGGRLDTSYTQFADNLLAELTALGFHPDARCVWSHHSYADFEGDTADRTADMRARLKGRWPGWPDGDANAPGLVITETGVRRTTVAKQLKSLDERVINERQAELLERGYERLRTGPAGDGVDVVMHYLFVTDLFYDSGLCDLDGTPRPAYYAWADLPTDR
jgi:hypothetical protein